MFKNLTNFGYQRDMKEALGFYIAYLILLMLVSGVSAGILGLAAGHGSFSFGLQVGAVVAVIISLAISFWVLKEKKLLSNFFLIILALLSGLLALFIGGLGGLIPAAYLTTRPVGVK